MVTKKTTPTPADKPIMWGNQQAEALDAADLVDKAELLGREFAITRYKFTHNPTANIGYAYLEAEFEPGGESFQFNDSSTGVRQQIEAYHSAKYPAEKWVLETWYPCLIVCPKGVRKSEYDTLDDRGKPARGKTYYLTGLAKRG